MTTYGAPKGPRESTMMRMVLAVVAGAAVMFVVIMAVEILGHALYPPPPGLDPMQPLDLQQIIAAQPFVAKAMVLLAWTLGALFGGLVAARIAHAHPQAAAIVVPVLVIAGVVSVIVQLPGHPLWMGVLGVLLPVPAAVLGARLVRPRPHL